MKMNFKNIKFSVTSPNESVNVDFHMEEISFEANLQEIVEMQKGSTETLKIGMNYIADIMEMSFERQKELITLQTDERLREADGISKKLHEKLSQLGSMGGPFPFPGGIGMMIKKPMKGDE